MSGKKRQWRKTLPNLRPDLINAETSANLVLRASRNSLYNLNVKGLNRSTKWHQKIRKYVENPSLSSYTISAIKKYKKLADQKDSEKYKPIKDCLETVPELWSESFQREAPYELKQKNQSVPSTESVSPVMVDYEKRVIAEVSDYVTRDENRMARKKFLYQPMTTMLYEYLQDSDLLNSLTNLQKQKAVMFFNELKYSVDRTNQSIPPETLRDALRDYCSKLIENYEIPDQYIYKKYPFAQPSMQPEVTTSHSLSIQKKKKTKKQRLKQKRHIALLRQFSATKDHQKFHASFEQLRNYMKELKEQDEEIQSKREQRQSLRNNVDNAQKNQGSALPSSSLLIPRDIRKAQGSLRKLKISSISASSLRDHMSVLYKRPSKPMAALLTSSSFARMKKFTNRKLNATKMVVRH